MSKNKESGDIGEDVITEEVPKEKSTPTIETVEKSKPKLIEVPKMKSSPLTDSPIIVRDYAAGAEDVEFEETKSDAKSDSPEAEVAQEPISDIGSGGDAGYEVGGEGSGSRVDPMEFEAEKEAEPEEVEAIEENADVQPVPDKTAKEGARKTAEWLMDMYCSVYPELLHRVTKMDEDEISVAEDSGEVVKGATDKVIEINEKNRKQLDVDQDFRRMIEKPLVETLTIYGLKISPPIMLILALAFVCIVMFITSRSISKSNERIIAKLIDDGKAKKEPEPITVDATEETPE